MASINEVLRKYAEHGRVGLLPAVEELARHGHVAEYLLDLTRGRFSPDDQLAGYRHPNGFSKIKLSRLPDNDWSLRLHVWDPNAADSDIHDHRWPFASYVASGSITERSYEVVLGEGQSAIYTCSASCDGSYVFSGARACHARLIAEDVHYSGSSYERDPRTLHQAMTNGSTRAVTVFVQGAQVKDSTTVVKRSRVPIEGVLASPLTASEVMSELCAALDLMANA